MTRSNIPGDLRGPNGVTERAPPFVMAIGGAASRRSPCSVLRFTGRMPTPAHSSCTASDATFPCPTTPARGAFFTDFACSPRTASVRHTWDESTHVVSGTEVRVDPGDASELCRHVEMQVGALSFGDHEDSCRVYGRCGPRNSAAPPHRGVVGGRGRGTRNIGARRSADHREDWRTVC